MDGRYVAWLDTDEKLRAYDAETPLGSLTFQWSCLNGTSPVALSPGVTSSTPTFVAPTEVNAAVTCTLTVGDGRVSSAPFL